MLRLTLPSDSMTNSQYTNRFYFVRRIIMVAVIACLCISSSEGLRLTPFPVFELAAVEATKKQIRSTASYEVSNKYNPTTMPTRPMKRGKHQVVDVATLPSEGTRKLAVQPVFLPIACAAFDGVSPLPFSPIPGRPPPFAS